MQQDWIDNWELLPLVAEKNLLGTKELYEKKITHVDVKFCSHGDFHDFGPDSPQRPFFFLLWL